MKSKMSLEKRMWWIFGSQFVMAINFTVGAVGLSVILLHMAETSNRDQARLAPHVRQEIQSEQDPAKLRQWALTFYEESVSDSSTRVMALNKFVFISSVWGACLILASLGAGAGAYYVRRETHKLSSTDYAQ